MRIAKALVVLSAIAVVAGCSQPSSVSIEQRKKLAGELRDNRLYAAAVEEYRDLLDEPSIDNAQRGTVSYLIGRIYFEDLDNFEQAAAWFVRAREYDPNGAFMTELPANLVAALEKAGRTGAARRELGSAVSLDTTPPKVGDQPVARIDGQPIWRSEVERAIDELPSEVGKQLASVQARREFVRQYVGRELLYRAAVREGMETDPELARRVNQMRKGLLVNRYVTEKVMPSVRLDTLDIRNYYAAHKADRYAGKPYDSVRAQVFMDYQGEKAENAYLDYINRLAAQQRVEFLDQHVQ